MTDSGKRNAAAPTGFFACEAAGLRWLSDVDGGVRCAQVVSFDATSLTLRRLDSQTPSPEAASEFGSRKATSSFKVAASNEPTGLITSLSISGNSGSVVNTGQSGALFKLADLYQLQGSLPAHYRPNASWLANNLVYSVVRQFDTAGGAVFWTNLTTDRPPQLYARDALEAEAMAGTPLVGGTKVRVYGDLSQYCITDRLGMAVEFLPHLFSKNNNRPTGTRGWFAYYRTGGDLVNATGVRVLNVTP